MTLLSVSYSDAGAAPPDMTLTLFQSGVYFRYRPQPYLECVYQNQFDTIQCLRHHITTHHIKRNNASDYRTESCFTAFFLFVFRIVIDDRWDPWADLAPRA
jgi:hypothetical protein